MKVSFNTKQALSLRLVALLLFLFMFNFKLLAQSADEHELVYTLNAHSYMVTSLSINSYSNLLVTASVDGTIKTWHISDGNLA